MKNILPFTRKLAVMLLIAIAVISCRKNDTVTDPSQPLLDQMKAVTDSVIKNTRVPGIVALVVGEGKISLEDKLSKYFPGYPKSDSVTIRMLCNMTSRIHDFFHITPSLFETMRANPDRVWSPLELIYLGFQAGFDSVVGAGWGYSTPRELQKYVEALVGGGLLPDSLQRRRLIDDYYNLPGDVHYGLGLLRMGSFFGHTGEFPG